VDEETKKNQNIINIIRDGQISLLVSRGRDTSHWSVPPLHHLLLLLLQPHLATDNLELIRDPEGNNLLHVSACHGHADCLQHLTSLMGEDGLNERNAMQLTPAGLGVKVRGGGSR